jgi:hypothetical protein
VSHTLKVIAGGIVLLGIFLLAGRFFSSNGSVIAMAGAARWFIPVWLIAAGVNMWVGVAKAGYSVARRPRSSWSSSRFPRWRQSS